MSADIYLYHTDKRGARKVHTLGRHLINLCERIRRHLDVQPHPALQGAIDTATAEYFTEMIGLQLTGIDIAGLKIVRNSVGETIEAGGDLEWVESLATDPIFAQHCLGGGTTVAEEMRRIRDVWRKKLVFLLACLDEKITRLEGDKSLKPEQLPVPVEPLVSEWGTWESEPRA